MEYTINHFMWGYQHYFRVLIESRISDVLEEFDSRFDPEVFLVGILADVQMPNHRACVEPENDFWIQSEEFDDTLSIAETILPTYPESGLFYSHPVAEQRVRERLFRRSVKDAVLQTVDVCTSKPKDRSFFSSIPVLVDKYLVCVLLSIDANILRQYRPLEELNILAKLEQYKDFVEPSLIDTLIDFLLDKAAIELYRPNPGENLITWNKRAIIQEAGSTFAWRLAYSIDPTKASDVVNIYSELCSIAELNYEQRVSDGEIILAKIDGGTVRVDIEFRDRILLKEHRKARKLLELATKGSALLTDGSQIFGIGTYLNDDSLRKKVFNIKIHGNQQWEIFYKDKILMGVKYQQPYLPPYINYEMKLKSDLLRLFPGITEDSCSLLISLVQKAEQERHGTLLIISQDAEKEANRLGKEATLITPCKLTPDTTKDLTGIDGAILVDTSGICYSIGTILDGVAVAKGDSSRGARYNSAIRYIEYSKSRNISALAVVVSEDKGVDFIPNLKPSIPRSLISSAINELEYVNSLDKVDQDRYYAAMDTLANVRFYILSVDCSKINQLKKEIKEKIWSEAGTTMTIEYSDFVPNEEMDPSFYYEPDSE